jgi:hypothetical protein
LALAQIEVACERIWVGEADEEPHPAIARAVSATASALAVRLLVRRLTSA